MTVDAGGAAATVWKERQRPDRGFWLLAWRRFRRNRLGLYSGALLLIMIAVALAAPVISAFVTHQTATGQDLNSVLANPSAQHWLGSDELGRDTLTRLAYGAQASLGVGVLTVAIVLAIGVPTGLAAGYLGGIVDDVLMRVVDVVLSTPAIFLYILMSILFRPNPILLAFIIASLSWAPVSRLVRAEAISLRDRDFMVATRAMGATNSSITNPRF